MNSKKLVSAVLTATTVLWMVGAAALPLANAQTTSSLQAQIAALLAQIQTLQGQLNTSGTTTTSVGANTYNFTSDLTVGSTGSAVTALQQFLIGQGDLVLATPTQYFGAMTQKALAKFQAAKGITPSVGYFGPKTRAFVNSMSTSTTTTTTTTTGTTVTAPATGLAVGLASDNPATGSLISSANSGSARVPVLAVNFTAGNSGAATLSGVSFQKTGVLSDSSISGAYLTQNGKVVAQYNSLNNGVINFTGVNLSIPAGQTVELQLAIDVSGGLSAGNTTGFALTSASAVTAYGANNAAITPTGSFPLNGNIFTVTSVTNPSLAYVSSTPASIGTSITAGSQGDIVAAYTFNVGNSKVYLKNINFHVIGSANKGDIQNVKLLVNGAQVGATLASVGSDGTAFFDASANPGILNTGNNNIQVIADVMGSPSYTFNFELLNGYDVLAVDSQYNVPVTVQLGGNQTTELVTIQPGTVVISQNSGTPTSNIAKGQSQVTLAQFNVTASGEAVKLKYLPFDIILSGITGGTTQCVTSTTQNVYAPASTTIIGTTSVCTQYATVGGSSLTSNLQNVEVVDDAGNQVGTTINQPGTESGVTFSGSTYTSSFGSSGSPINYTIPANTTRVLSLKADIPSSATFNSIVGNFLPGTNNLQGMVSNSLSSTGGANGVTLTLVQSSLTVSPNSALGIQNVSAGTSGIKIGSYAFSASSAEGANVNTVSVELTPATTTPLFQNLRLMVNGTQFGTEQSSLTGEQTYSFSGSAFNVPAGQTVNVDVYADSLSNATGSPAAIGYATALTAYSGSGQVSYTPLPASGFSTVNGQKVGFNGQPALGIAVDNNTPAAYQVVQGSTGNTLAVFDLLETSDVENVKVTQLNVLEQTTSTLPDFSNVALYNGNTLLGTSVGTPVTTSTGYIYQFNNLTNMVVPMGSSLSVTLKGDVGTKSAGSILDGSAVTFAIVDPTSFVARGATSNVTAGVTGSATAQPITVLRSTLQVAVAGQGVQSGRAKANPDALGTITFTPNTAGSVALNSMKITFSGSAQPVLTTSTSSPTVWLVDQANNTFYPATTTANTVTFNFGNASSGYRLNSNSGSYVFTLKLNTASVNGSSSVSQSLSANIANAVDVQYTDALDGTGVTVGLPASLTGNLTINSVSYAQGN